MKKKMLICLLLLFLLVCGTIAYKQIHNVAFVYYKEDNLSLFYILKRYQSMYNTLYYNLICQVSRLWLCGSFYRIPRIYYKVIKIFSLHVAKTRGGKRYATDFSNFTFTNYVCNTPNKDAN